VHPAADPDRRPSTTAERWRRLAAELTRRIEGVPPDGWERPAPCEGWVARDVVRHLVEWMPSLYFGSIGRDVPGVPSVDVDPVAAWSAVDDAIQAALDDPATAQLATETRAGSMTFDALVEMTGLMDLLVHTWDLARATGQDETLDRVEVGNFLPGLEQWGEAMVASGHFGPPTPVADHADEQTRLLAFTGRRP